MKLVKSLLLGSAAGLAAAAGAQAADLPFRKAAPVEYVRVCDWTGAGYFYIPGTDTCIKFGGFVRAEYAYVEPQRSFTPNLAVQGVATGTYLTGREKSASGFFVRAQLQVDARTQTAYGLLRSFIQLQADRNGGNYNGLGGLGGGAYADKAYITFAGISAGRMQSFFDLYADNWNYDGIANSDESTEVLAYTATFGGGFSATLSAEDPNSGRKSGISQITLGNTFVPNTVGYGGTRYPDGVIQLRYDQAWGAVQLSGAYHNVNTVANTGAAAVQAATDSGFAVQAGIDVKLPMLAAGDELFIQGAYENGAYLYQDSDSNMHNGFYSQVTGGFVMPTPDAVAVGNGLGTGYSLHLSEGWSVMAAIHHYFTPQFHDVLYGSYEEVGYGNVVRNIDWTRGGIGDQSQWRIGNQFLFTPVHNMTIGLDVMYSKINQDLAHERGLAPTALPAGIAKDPDSFMARLRLERDF